MATPHHPEDTPEKPMKLVFLTRFHSHHGAHEANPLGHRLVQAALAQGHELQIINPADVLLEFGSVRGGPTGNFPVLWRGQPFPRTDFILPMARADDTHTWQIADTLQSWGHPVSMHQRLPLGDHITMARLLARRNIPSPRSWVLSHPEQLGIIIPELQFPILMRSRYGGTGRKVAVVAHSGEAYSHAAQLAVGGQPFLVQDLPQPLGEDLRVLVVGNGVQVAVHRQAPAGFVRPKEEGNLRVTPTRLTPTEEALALAAARMYGAPFCAVNLLRSPQGPMLLEVSRVPTLAELETATGQDLATPIIQELVNLAARLAAQGQEGPVVALPTAQRQGF
jgi:ribosomal protein S6--L-glutamate ligase